MRYGIYSIRDSAAQIFTSPTVDITDQSAIRGFAQAVKNSDSVMNFNPTDFCLYRLGFFDVESGSIDPIVPPVLLASGDGIVKAVIDDED